MDPLKASVRTLELWLKPGYFLGFHPCYWDDELGLFQYNNSSRLKIIFWAHMLITNLYVIFLAIRVTQSAQDTNIDL
jgi:hypothetical protein